MHSLENRYKAIIEGIIFDNTIKLFRFERFCTIYDLIYQNILTISLHKNDS
jgi:hypothetical protein